MKKNKDYKELVAKINSLDTDLENYIKDSSIDTDGYSDLSSKLYDLESNLSRYHENKRNDILFVFLKNKLNKEKFIINEINEKHYSLQCSLKLTEKEKKYLRKNDSHNGRFDKIIDSKYRILMASYILDNPKNCLDLYVTVESICNKRMNITLCLDILSNIKDIIDINVCLKSHESYLLGSLKELNLLKDKNS